MDSGRSCVPPTWPRCGRGARDLIAALPELRQIVFSEEVLERSPGGAFLDCVDRPKVGSPKPGLTFGDSGLDFTSTSRITTSPFPSAESQ